MSGQPTEAERVAALQQQAAADYARYQATRASATQADIQARINGNQQAGTR